MLLFLGLLESTGCGGTVRAELPGPNAADGGRDSAPGREGGQGDACVFADEPPAESVTVLFRNEGVQPAYVSQRLCSDFFEVKPIDVNTNGTYPAPDPHGRCYDWQRYLGCFRDEGCGSVSLQLAPGEEVAISWTGAIFPSVTVPQECDPPALGWTRCKDHCLVQRAAPVGRYRLEIKAGSQAPVCLKPEGCACQRFPDGTCRIGGAPLSSDLDAQVEFAYPASDPITVAFR